MWIQSLRTYYASEKEMNTLRLCITLGTVPVSCAAAANRFRRGGSIRVRANREFRTCQWKGARIIRGARMENQERERRSELTTEKGGFGWEQEKEVQRGREHDRIEDRPSEREREREQVWERQGQIERVSEIWRESEYSLRETEFSYLGTPHPHPDISAQFASVRINVTIGSAAGCRISWLYRPILRQPLFSFFTCYRKHLFEHHVQRISWKALQAL